MQTMIRVMGYPPDNGSKLPFYLALEAGIFERNGLQISFHDPGSNEKLFEGVKKGMADIYVISAVNVIGNETTSGADLVIVANTGYHYFRFMTDSSIAKPDDLKGKKVATSGLGSAASLIDRLVLSKIGLDPDKDVTLVRFGGPGREFGRGGLARFNALISGEVSATTVTSEGLFKLETSGLDKKFRVLTDYKKLNVYTGGGGDYVVPRKFLRESRDEAKAFFRSICEAIALARKDRLRALDTLRKTMRITDPAQLDFTYRIYVERVIPQRPYVRPESIELAIQVTSSRADAQATQAQDLIDHSLIQELESEGLFEQ